MEPLLKKFLAKVSPRETRELVQDHVKRVEVSPGGREITLHVDKRYAFRAINSHDHVESVIRSVKKAFGTSVSTVIELDLVARKNHEREKAVPHAIHYR